MAGHDYRSALDVLQNSGQDWCGAGAGAVEAAPGTRCACCCSLATLCCAPPAHHSPRSMCANGTRNHGAVMGAVNQFAMLHGLHVSVT